MSRGRIQKHSAFLCKLLNNPNALIYASDAEIEFFVEIVFNHLNNNCVLITKRESGLLQQILPLLRKISKSTSVPAARSLIGMLSSASIKALIRPVLSLF